MHLYQFQSDALRTESLFESFNVNPQLFMGALQTFIGVGNIMDQIKKNACYGSEFNNLKMEAAFAQISTGTALMSQVDWLTMNTNPKTALEINPRIAHGLVGIMTEASELAEALLVGLESGEIDPINIQEETIDINWYQAILHDALNLSWEKGLDNNIAKLKSRYPDQFTQEAAEKRDISAERIILESTIPTS